LVDQESIYPVWLCSQQYSCVIIYNYNIYLFVFSRAERVDKLREEKRTKRREVTLLRAPLRSLSIFALVMVQYAWQGLDYVRLHSKASGALAALALTLFVLNHTPGAHTEVRFSSQDRRTAMSEEQEHITFIILYYIIIITTICYYLVLSKNHFIINARRWRV
jgi:hypothetical protein